MTVFSRRGFERGSTREIAKAAGCNIAAIRYYFGDKAGLIASVMESSMEALMEGGGHPVLAPPGPRVEPREELRTWILWVLRTGRRKRRSSASPGAGADPAHARADAEGRDSPPPRRAPSDRIGLRTPSCSSTARPVGCSRSPAPTGPGSDTAS